MKNDMVGRRHSKFTMTLNIPEGQYPPDPEHGGVTYVMYRDWCECDRLRDHAGVIDLAKNSPEATDE